MGACSLLAVELGVTCVQVHETLGRDVRNGSLQCRQGSGGSLQVRKGMAVKAADKSANLQEGGKIRVIRGSRVLRKWSWEPREKDFYVDGIKAEQGSNRRCHGANTVCGAVGSPLLDFQEASAVMTLVLGPIHSMGDILTPLCFSGYCAMRSWKPQT